MKTVLDGIKALLAMLDELPNKKLIASKLWSDEKECGCLFGSVMPQTIRETLRVSPVMISSRGLAWTNALAKGWGEALGLTTEWTAALIQLNDIGEETPEAKYARVYGVLTELSKCSPAGLDAIMRVWKDSRSFPVYEEIKNWSVYQ